MNELTDWQVIDKAYKHMGWAHVENVGDNDIKAFARAIIEQDRAQRQAGQKPTAWFVSGPKLYRTVYLRGDIEPAIEAMVAEDPNSDADDYTATALYTAPPAAPVPEGFRLVPLEPTQEMLDAPPNAWPADAKISYAAMLAAAPYPSQGAAQ